MNSPHFSMKNKITEGASELEKQRRSASQGPKRKAWGRGCARAVANRKRRHKGHRVRVGGPRRVLEQIAVAAPEFRTRRWKPSRVSGPESRSVTSEISTKVRSIPFHLSFLSSFLSPSKQDLAECQAPCWTIGCEDEHGRIVLPSRRPA